MTRSNDTIYMSDKKGSCSPGQTPKVKQTDGSGTLTMEVLGRIFMIVFFFKLNSLSVTHEEDETYTIFRYFQILV